MLLESCGFIEQMLKKIPLSIKDLAEYVYESISYTIELSVFFVVLERYSRDGTSELPRASAVGVQFLMELYS